MIVLGETGLSLPRSPPPQSVTDCNHCWLCQVALRRPSSLGSPPRDRCGGSGRLGDVADVSGARSPATPGGGPPRRGLQSIRHGGACAPPCDRRRSRPVLRVGPDARLPDRQGVQLCVEVCLVASWFAVGLVGAAGARATPGDAGHGLGCPAGGSPCRADRWTDPIGTARGRLCATVAGPVHISAPPRRLSRR